MNEQTRIYITPIQRRVLTNLAARPRITPDTVEELEAYSDLCDKGLAGYSDAARAAVPTALGYEVLKAVQP